MSNLTTIETGKYFVCLDVIYKNKAERLGLEFKDGKAALKGEYTVFDTHAEALEKAENIVKDPSELKSQVKDYKLAVEIKVVVAMKTTIIKYKPLESLLVCL